MNSTIYTKNCQVLQEKYPKLYQALEQQLYEDEAVAIGVTQVADRNILYAVLEDSQYQLDSLYDSETLLNIWRSHLREVTYQTNFIWFGLGNGMYLRKLLDTTEVENRILIYEPSLSILAVTIENFDIGSLLEQERVQLIVPGYTGAFDKAAFQILDFSNKNELQYGAYLNYNLIFEKEAENFLSSLQLVLNSINSTQSVLKRFGEAYFQNTLGNLPYLVAGRTLEQLYYALPKDVPAVIVAAGPSLDKNVQELKKAKNRAFLIAVDTAARALLKYDVIPDLFITVDGKKLASHFTDERLRTIPVVCCLQGNRDALGVHTGLKFFFDDENAYIREFFKQQGREFAGLSTGGSVANDAFSLADTLRFHTIILVGQDLAYTNYQSHASGTVSGETGAEIGDHEVIEVDGYYGGSVPSSVEFQLYKKWFEDTIAENPQLKVINATEGGADIRGTEKLPLSEAVRRECSRTVDFGQLIRQIPPFFDEQGQKKFWEYLAEAVSRLTELQSDTQNGLHNYDQMKELIRQPHCDKKRFTELTQANRTLTERLDAEPVMCFVQYRLNELSMDYMDTRPPEAATEEEKLVQAVEQGSRYMENVCQAIGEAIPILKRCFIEERTEEILEKNRTLAQIQGLLGQMQLNAQKAMRCMDE